MSILLFSLDGCITPQPYAETTSVNKNQSETMETVFNEIEQTYITDKDGYKFHPDTNFASFDKPHKIGEAVRIDFIDPWNQHMVADVVVHETIRGEAAKEWLENTDFDYSTMPNLFEIYEVALVKLKKQQISDEYSVAMWDACDRSGNLVSDPLEPLWLEIKDGGIDDVAPNVQEGWIITLVPKKIKEYTVALFIGDILEAPGIVATYYFAME